MKSNQLFFLKLPMLMMLALTLLTANHVVNAASQQSLDAVFRFTDSGAKNSAGETMAHYEGGSLFAIDGFLVINITPDYSLDHLGLDQATLSAINGKLVQSLLMWVTSHNSGANLSAFQRSSETYSVDGVPYVIVSLVGSSSSGTTTPVTGNVCTSVVTTITAGNPAVSISSPQPNASEAGLINGRFQIDLDAPRAVKTKVIFTIVGSAPNNGKDYTKIKNFVVIPAGTTAAFVDIVPVNDKKKEVAETVTLNLQAAANYTLSTSATATVNIADND
jgi:hypothetical protein